jgi:hypothetical protein
VVLEASIISLADSKDWKIPLFSSKDWKIPVLAKKIEENPVLANEYWRVRRASFSATFWPRHCDGKNGHITKALRARWRTSTDGGGC